MRSRTIVVAQVGGQETAQMWLVEHDDVIQAFAADGADEALDLRTLPRCPGSCEYFRDAEPCQAATEAISVHSIAIA